MSPSFILGIDEAGRGPLAGPVVAAGVVLDPNKPIVGLNDSKKLSEKARESLYQSIRQSALVVAVKEISPATIDQINILQATLKAMGEVIAACLGQMNFDRVMIDGTHTVPGYPDIHQEAIIKGDSLVPNIMAASIVAKVYRDNLMAAYEDKYPGYGFLSHKGYGTKAHLMAIEKLGPSPIHRMSFAPLKDSSWLSK